MSNTYKILVRKPKEKRPLGRPRHRWENNIKTNHKEVEYDDEDWIHLAQESTIGGLCKHGDECSGSINGREFLKQLSDC
jgi:hypothetical protein